MVLLLSKVRAKCQISINEEMEPSVTSIIQEMELSVTSIIQEMEPSVISAQS